MPPSHQNAGLIDINDLPSINYNVDYKGNFFRANLSTNVKDYLKIEKIGDKNIARVKFSITALSLGEMTLRFSNVRFNNGAHCYVYTSDYEIVAGPVYEKSISNVLNIVKIPANELILEIVFNSVNDVDLILNTISYQSIIDVSKKKGNSLQEAIPDSIWDCSNCNYGDKNFVDNVGDSYNLYGASLLGAGDSCELFYHSRLHSVVDTKLNAGRASCIIMEPPHDNIDYYGAYPGTLMNFPGTNCKGIIFSAYHHGFIQNICYYTIQLNNGNILPSQQFILDNTLIRFNWHHKYGKPWHLADKCLNPTTNDFQLWRKTIDFDEVIDYCGIRGVAYAEHEEDADFAILKMEQTPFYKELHLGWTSQLDFEYLPPALGNKRLVYPNVFSILGRHAATPTYVYTSTEGEILNYTNIHDDERYTKGLRLRVIPFDEPQMSSTYPGGWSGSQIVKTDYTDSSQVIGLGLIMQGGGSVMEGANYNYLFNYRNCEIIDPDLPNVSLDTADKTLYTKYLDQFESDITVFHHFGADYWMYSVENREKCPSTIPSETDTCEFDFSDYINVEYKDGKMIFTINIAGISSSLFPGNQYPKGIRIYRASGDQQTFFFDTFADDIDIGPTIEFTINKCDLFYYQMMGDNPIQLGFDFYDSEGKILKAPGCNMTYSYPFPNVNPCEQISITTKRDTLALPSCCSYEIEIQLNACDDYSNILRLMLERMSVVNLTNNNTTALNIQNGIIIDYIGGKINFSINNICDTTNFRLIGLFDGNENCESFDFTVDCVIPEPPCDCCKVYHAKWSDVIGYSGIGGGSIIIEPHQFIINFSGLGNRKYQKYCPDCRFLFAEVFCPNPNPSPSDSTPVLDETMLGNQFGFCDSYYGSFEGYDPDTYCFYFIINTNEGICYDTLCVDYDGTYITNVHEFPIITIKIDSSNNNNLNSLILSPGIEYEKFYIVDMNGKVLIESEPADKLEISKLSKGTYNILYRKKDKVIQSQKLIIE